MLNGDEWTSDEKGDFAEAIVNMKLKSLQFRYTETDGKYPAQDGFLQLTHRPRRGHFPAKNATGTYLGVEVKSGEYYVAIRDLKVNSVVINIKRRFVEVWQGSMMPFVLCWVDLRTNELYWASPKHDVVPTRRGESQLVQIRCVAYDDGKLVPWLWRLAHSTNLINGLDSRTLPTVRSPCQSGVGIRALKSEAQILRAQWNANPPQAPSFANRPVTFPYSTWKHLTAFSRSPTDVISKLMVLDAARLALAGCPIRSRWRHGWQVVVRVERPGKIFTFLRVVFVERPDGALCLFTVYEVVPDGGSESRQKRGAGDTQ